MGGSTRIHHVATYDSTDAVGLCHAVQRLPVVIQQLERELVAAIGDPVYADAAVAAVRQVRALAASATALLHQALERNEVELPSSHEWLKSLVGTRRTLLSELTHLEERLRAAENPASRSGRES